MPFPSAPDVQPTEKLLPLLDYSVFLPQSTLYVSLLPDMPNLATRRTHTPLSKPSLHIILALLWLTHLPPLDLFLYCVFSSSVRSVLILALTIPYFKCLCVFLLQGTASFSGAYASILLTCLSASVSLSLEEGMDTSTQSAPGKSVL